jgi:hypothetical protein
MKRLVIAAIVIGLLAVVCGANGPAALGPGPSGSPAASPSPTAAPTGGSPSPTVSPSPGKPFTFQIWLVRGGKLFETKRTEPFVQAVAQLALNDLVSGPNGLEIAASVETAIPAATADITSLRAGEAAVNLTVPGLGGASAKIVQRLPLAQLVYTITQYPTISGVQFSVNGTLLDGRRYTRASLEDLLPPIVVGSPVIGQSLTSPVTVAGTADVFEATISVRILDENGKEIARTFTNASCGTGCRGDYSTSVRYSVSHQQSGTVEVYEVSAKDGSAIKLQDIPVILTP